MKARIEKKLSKRLVELYPALYCSAWRDEEPSALAYEQGSRVRHVLSVGGGVDYWGEGQDAYGTPFDDGGWTGWQARAALAQPSPVRSSLLINGYQLRAALDFIAPDGTAEQLESEACIEWRQQDADFLEAGLYAFCAEYPEEGGVLLDEEPTTAQPSPLQSEQAEAERPEVVAYRTIGRHTKHQHPHYALNYYKQNAEDQAAHWRERGCEVSEDELMTVAQHERIVGALRAENAKLSEALDRWPLIRDSLKLRLADALARVAGLEAELETERVRLSACATAALGYFDGCADAYKSASLSDVLRLRGDCDAALAMVAELEKKLGESEKRGSELAASYCDGVVGDEYGHAYCRYKSERDAALAKIAELEKELAMASDAASKGDAARHAAGGMEMEIQELKAKLAEQAQHSVPEGWKPVPIEPLLNMMSDKDHDTRIMAERQLLSILAAAPGKEGV